VNKIELNKLAVTAKQDIVALWEIKAYYIPLIEKLQLENWYKMNSETAFEDDCFRKLEYAVRTYEQRRGDFDKRAKALIYQSVKEYCGRRGNRRDVLDSLDDRARTSNERENDSTLLATIKDEKLDVEAAAIEEVTKQELIEKYAANEVDKLVLDIILDAEGLITQSEITRRLADKTGRTFNSARGVVRSFCARKQAALC
jgi:uncharacterized membrane protein